MKIIAHMVDEVCKKVGTRWFPPRSKRGKDDMDVHLQPSRVTERSYDPTKYTLYKEEETPN